MKFLLNFDLFGKEPDLYYKGKSKKNTNLGLIFTLIYVILYLTYLIFKLVRMINRVDVKFYDTYAYDEEIPSIYITNDNFYGAFKVGEKMDETLYYIKVKYIRGVKNGEEWNNTSEDLEIEPCNIEKFGVKHRVFFNDESLNKSYCLKNINLTLEGYSYLNHFSYINLQIFPCVNQTKDGRVCKDYNTKYNFFKENIIEFKMQDNLLTPEIYKSPVKPFKKDITCPIYLKLFQKIYSYIQIVRVETDEDITGINIIPKNKIEIFTKYQDSFVIASPGSDEILKTGGPVCDITLQLAANVLTQRRNYTTLLDVMGEVGGLMEFIYSIFSQILSFIVNESYEKSLVNNLFSFNKNKKLIIFKNKEVKNNIKDFERKNDKKINFFENENDDAIYENKIYIYKSMINHPPYNNIELTNNNLSSNSDLTPYKKGKKKKTEKYEIIENINKICLCLRTKKRNIEKIFYEEGMKLIEEKLDIANLFINSFRVEEYKEKLTINKFVLISEENRKYISYIKDKNNLVKKWKNRKKKIVYV